MKPCLRNQKFIAWMLLGALDDRQARTLRAHLETCEGCRGYLREISSVTEKFAAVAHDSKIEASESFHQNLIRRLKAEESASLWETAAVYLRAASLEWRVALTVVAVITVAVAMLFVGVRRHGFSSPPQTAMKPVPAPGAESISVDLAPTISNYQMVANRSLEQLDDLLTRQGNRNPPPVPGYTASTLPGVNVAD